MPASCSSWLLNLSSGGLFRPCPAIDVTIWFISWEKAALASGVPVPPAPEAAVEAPVEGVVPVDCVVVVLLEELVVPVEDVEVCRM